MAKQGELPAWPSYHEQCLQVPEETARAPPLQRNSATSLPSPLCSMLIANLTFRDSPNHQLEIYASPTEIVGVSILAPSSTSPTPSHNTVSGAAAAACCCR